MSSETTQTQKSASSGPRAAIDHRRIDLELMHHLIARLMRLWFRLYGRWTVIGLENVPMTGPLLVVANHVSDLDPFLGWSAIYVRRRMWGIAKVELWANRASAYLMACIGAIPVKRNTADRTMIRTVLDLLARGEAVGLFPEGTRSPDGRLQPAQPGLALLAEKSGAPILPVALLGTYEMLPRGRKRLRRVPLKVVFGKPMAFPTEGSREERLAAIMQAIADLMTANGQPTEAPHT
jgi:1-acyl-sn-glycerol-3-phosphate acyltransferase